MPSLTSLAEELLAQAKQIDKHLESKNLPSPSFDTDVLAALPPELEQVRTSLASISHDLKTLTLGPVGSTTAIIFSVSEADQLICSARKTPYANSSPVFFQWTDVLPLRVIYHYKIAHIVPLEGSASYAEIASQVGLHEDIVFRFLRAAMSNHIFDEDPATGHVRHTAISHLLATNTGFADSVGLQIEELGPAGTRVIDAWNKWGPEAREPNQTAFALLNNTELPIFDVLGAHPARAQRFGSAMHFYTRDGRWDLPHMLNAYDWGTLDRDGALVIDIGGGKGSISQFLARHTAHVRFLVQDLAHVVPTAREELPAELAGRVEFMIHDFFKPQPPQSTPDAFLLSWILHNWPDEYCVRILRALVPVLRPGNRVLIYEYVLADEPVRDLEGRFGLQLDMIMCAAFNGRERRRAEYELLLARSDERFVLEAVRRAKGSTMSIIEVVWKGSG